MMEELSKTHLSAEEKIEMVCACIKNSMSDALFEFQAEKEYLESYEVEG